MMSALLLTRGGLDITDLAENYRKDVVDTAKVYSVMSDRLGLIWLARSAEDLEVEGRWQALARSNLRDEFYLLRWLDTTRYRQRPSPPPFLCLHNSAWLAPGQISPRTSA